VNELVQLEGLRPFYFVMVVWGEQYRNYFLEYCLPALLAPKNIPAVSKVRTVKYLIATTTEDWSCMQQTTIFRELKRYVNPTFIQLPLWPADRPYWMQNILGHKLCCDLIFNEKGYRIFTSPDAIYSNGSIARLHELALGSVDVVMKLTVPLTQKEDFFASLKQVNVLPMTSARDTGKPIICSGRQLASAAIRSMHSMSAVNEWQAPYFCGYASTPWWRVEDCENAIITCGVRWDVLLLDYAAVNSQESSLLEERGWDGDYIMRTFGDLESFHLVRDSDELMLVSWSSEPAVDMRRRQIWGEVGKGVGFRASYYSNSLNSLHRQLLFFPTRIHSGTVDDKKWHNVEAQALRTLLTWVMPPAGLQRLARRLPPTLNNYPDLEMRIAELSPAAMRRLLAKLIYGAALAVSQFKHTLSHSKLYKAILRVTLSVFSVLRIIGQRLVLALQGDRVALDWWLTRIQKYTARALRRPFQG